MESTSQPTLPSVALRTLQDVELGSLICTGGSPDWTLGFRAAYRD